MTLKQYEYYRTSDGTIYHGNVLDVLKAMPDESIQMCVTSPPYWGLRDYGIEPQVWDGSDCEHVWDSHERQGYHTGQGFQNLQEWNGQERTPKEIPHTLKVLSSFCSKCGCWKGSLGLEPTPELFIKHMVQVFAEVKRVLRDDGTIWVNMGDSYAQGGGQLRGKDETADKAIARQARRGTSTGQHGGWEGRASRAANTAMSGLKPKDLCGIPWMLAFALRADGWYLRSAIPWIKKNCMPESCKDRPTNAIEHIFLLSKSEKYFYDHEAVKLPASSDTHARYARGRSDNHKWADGGPGNQTIARSMQHMVKKPGVTPKSAPSGSGIKANDSFQAACKDVVGTRARRNSDWFFESFQGLLTDDDGEPLAFIVNSKGFSAAHFATFPKKLVEPCILAGSAKGDVVLDPFLGSGTTAIVAYKHGRKFVGIELSQTYLDDIAIPRIEAETRQLKLFA